MDMLDIMSDGFDASTNDDLYGLESALDDMHRLTDRMEQSTGVSEVTKLATRGDAEEYE
ncbi:hypothetical protein [Nocardioides mesophilus]|uniref:Uncharacterized protein n=1 Tax=Nocardioides mesophilus TaxID=433659 RepID=A0A7G9RC58_9ACTN|nr:hypothetical protein [Nocardioides mesophilus]QNN53183.1 hypothetical protein H9L09_01425 [Nocardioides mesophilus]